MMDGTGKWSQPEGNEQIQSNIIYGGGGIKIHSEGAMEPKNWPIDGANNGSQTWTVGWKWWDIDRGKERPWKNYVLGEISSMVICLIL